MIKTPGGERAMGSDDVPTVTVNEKIAAKVLGIEVNKISLYRKRGLVRPSQDPRSNRYSWTPELLYRVFCISQVEEQMRKDYPLEVPARINQRVRYEIRNLFSSGRHFEFLSDKGWKEVVQRAPSLGIDFSRTRFNFIRR